MADNTFKRYELKYMLDRERYEQVMSEMIRYMQPDRFAHSQIINIYFDTPSHRLIRDSIEKPVYKEKLRLRSYGVPDDDSEVFIELKKKYKSVVYKRRLEVPEQEAMDYLVGGQPLHEDCQIGREIDGMTSICLNVNMENTNRILGDKCITLWGQSYITDYIGDIKYQISPLSFYQVNPVQTNVLYNKALEYADLSGDETVWDMYCGIGTISLFLAQKAKKVYGVEIVPQAIDDARHNAEINGITNAEFFVGKAEEVVPDIYKKGGDGSHADVVVVDPPRKGCDQVLLDTLVHMAPERIVYVSCDPATLARDLKRFVEEGTFSPVKITPVDLFPQTFHCETVVHLKRN